LNRKTNFKKARCIASIVLLLLATLMLSVRMPEAHATKTIYFKPSIHIFAPENATVGTLFNVSVWVSSDSYPYNLMMWQVYMEYNATMINVTTYYSSALGENAILAWPNMDNQRDWDPSYVFYGIPGGMVGPAYYYRLPNGMGAIKIGDTLFSDTSVDGEKLLCIVQFNITQMPPDGTLSSILHINNEDTYLYNSEGPLPDTIVKEDGEYLFIPEFGLLILFVTAAISTVATATAKKIRKAK